MPCEVIEADDFEAMRQNFARNLHGTINKVRQGRVFQKMMTSRSLSQRELAEELGISEGTVRNFLAFVEAVEMRKPYAGDDAEDQIARISVESVRRYRAAPKDDRDTLLDGLLSGTERCGVPRRADCSEGQSEALPERPGVGGTDSQQPDIPAPSPTDEPSSQDDNEAIPSDLTEGAPDTGEVPRRHSSPERTATTAEGVKSALQKADSLLSRQAEEVTVQAVSLDPAVRQECVTLLRSISERTGAMLQVLAPDKPDAHGPVPA